MLAEMTTRWDTHTQFWVPQTTKIARSLFVTMMCGSIWGKMINVTVNEARRGTDERGGEVPIWSTIPSSSQACLLCSIAEWWWIKVQSPDLAHTTNNPTAAGAERQCNISSCLHKSMEHISDKQSTPRNTVPVSLFALQATWLMGHSVVTDRGARKPFAFVCVQSFCDSILLICVIFFALLPIWNGQVCTASLSLLTAESPVQQQGQEPSSQSPMLNASFFLFFLDI